MVVVAKVMLNKLNTFLDLFFRFPTRTVKVDVYDWDRDGRYFFVLFLMNT